MPFHRQNLNQVLAHYQSWAHYTATTVEIFQRGVRVASHARSAVPHAATTNQNR